MEILDRVLLGNTVRAWLIAAGITLGLTIVLRTMVSVVIGRLRQLAGRTATDVDDIAVEVLSRTKLLFLVFLGVWAGSRTLELGEGGDWAVRVFGILTVVVQAAAWGNVAIASLIRRQISRTIEADPATATTINALGYVLRAALWVVLLLAALANLGIEIGPLLAGLGVGGIAVALAVQNILGDLFASLSIVLDKPFVIGDFIVVGNMAGTVEHIGLKTTRVRSISGEQLIFANSDLLSSRIQNFRRMQERRILFRIGVTYQTSRDLLARIPDMIRASIESQPLARFDRAHFKEFGDSAFIYEVVFFVLSPEYLAWMEVQQAINLEIMRRFEEHGIAFAYPTRTVFLTREHEGLQAIPLPREQIDSPPSAQRSPRTTGGD